VFSSGFKINNGNNNHPSILIIFMFASITAATDFEYFTVSVDMLNRYSFRCFFCILLFLTTC
jgi:hypothetical protein